MRWIVLLFWLGACGGVAWDTHVADTAVVRQQMVASVAIGDTTEDQYVARWGNPYQRARYGARVDYVYRSALGDPSHFVIVTFEMGVAIAVKLTETEACRADFAPRFPGYGWDTPEIVKPIGTCGPAWSGADGVPGVIRDRYVPAPGSAK